MSNGGDCMVAPIGFFWSKILPIPYDNYLSETEILEALRKKVVELIDKVNQLGSSVEDLSGDLQQAIDSYYKDNVLPQLETELEGILTRIDSLESNTMERLDNMKIYVDTMDNHILAKLTDLETKHDADIVQLQEEVQLLTRRFETELQAISERFDFMKEYVDKQDSVYYTKVLLMFHNLYHNVANYVQKYFDELSNTNITVVSPITARKMSLQACLEEIVQSQESVHGLTALQYYMLNLTADEYKALNLTAEEYRLYGINRDSIKVKETHYNLFGERKEEPLSSVYQAFGHGIDNTLYNTLGLTCDQLESLSEIYTAYDFDNYGLFIYTNQRSAWDGSNLVLHSGQKTAVSGQHSTSVELLPMTDGTIVPYVNILSADKVKHVIMSNHTIGYDITADGEIDLKLTSEPYYDNGVVKVDVLTSNTLKDSNANDLDFKYSLRASVGI